MLLVPAFVGHTLQLLGEDTPWAPHAWARYWFEPGWHLYLPPWIPAVIAVGLAGAVIGLAVFRTRPWVAAIVVLYALHYLTYPYRIRNHMTLMLSELVMLGGLWAIDRWRGAPPRSDRYVAAGVAAVLCVTYFFAGFHKINDVFLSLTPVSPAVQGIDDFWIYGDLGSQAPTWARALAAWGTVVIECAVPIVAWRVPRLTAPAMLLLFAFHFPMVSVLNVSDYPMLASAFYPALFTHARFRLVLRHARRPTAFTVTGAVIGAAAQLWFMPWWGALTGFGIFVMALWGWSAGAIVAMYATRYLR
ncbi:MAG: hypothetical protein KC619_07170 [Myxococcales bacterium]|nr:hypothetical protein [Myxococcales bacterium]